MFLHPVQDGVSSGQSSAAAAADGAAAFSGILGIPPTCRRRCRGRQLNQACVSLSGNAASVDLLRSVTAVTGCVAAVIHGFVLTFTTPPPSTQLQLFLCGLAFCTHGFFFSFFFNPVTRKH